MLHPGLLTRPQLRCLVKCAARCEHGTGHSPDLRLTAVSKYRLKLNRRTFTTLPHVTSLRGTRYRSGSQL